MADPDSQHPLNGGETQGFSGAERYDGEWLTREFTPYIRRCDEDGLRAHAQRLGLDPREVVESVDIAAASARLRQYSGWRFDPGTLGLFRLGCGHKHAVVVLDSEDIERMATYFMALGRIGILNSDVASHVYVGDGSDLPQFMREHGEHASGYVEHDPATGEPVGYVTNKGQRTGKTRLTEEDVERIAAGGAEAVEAYLREHGK